MFENFSKKVVGMGNSIKRSTQTFSETVSLNARIDEYKKELGNCFSQLGQNYYEKNKMNVPAEYQGVFERITQLNQMIVQCQEQIKIIKGVRQCPNCGADVAGNVMFCGNCGYSMPPVNQAPANGPVCTNCGAPLEADAMFCTNCGAKVQAAAPQQNSFGQGGASFGHPVQQPSYGQPAQQTVYGQPVQQPVYDQPTQQPVREETVQPETVNEPEQDQAEQPEVMDEPVYDAPAQPEENAEPMRKDTDPEPAYGQETPVEPVQQAPAGKVCPRCGASLAADAAFCNNCGASVLAAGASAQESYSYGQAADRYCPNCGTKLESDALFCAECGMKVD